MSAVGDVVPVRLAGGRFTHDLRAVRVVWKREIIRFLRNRSRIVTSLVQPVLFLFVLGTGLSKVVPHNGGGGADYRTFMFPGILAMTVLFTAVFSAVSIVWDREFGFLREMLVAPVRRGALVLGKCLGGATVAAFQGALLLVLAGFVHVPYDGVLFVELTLILIATAFAVTAFGVLVASRIAQVESFQMVMQFVVLPMFFLSGAIYPLTRLPTWLHVLTRLDPLTYSVDPMRHVIRTHLSRGSAHVLAQLDTGLSWFGYRLGMATELGIVVVFGVVALIIAALQFGRPE